MDSAGSQKVQYNGALKRARRLVEQMTPDEKVSQMVHDSPAIERLGIPAFTWWNEALHGVGFAGKATVFPQAIGMAASFNDELLHEVATAISDEARAKHHDAERKGHRRFGLTMWSPNINIFRDPRWGRGQETYGEDPYLTSRMGVSFVKGLQGDDPQFLKTVATPKHFAVHSGPEALRHRFDAQCSQRDLFETYLPAFKACVQEGGAEAVMGAYNRTNGEPCCASPTLLQKILRDAWGFEGHVVSDCGAIQDFHSHHKITPCVKESAALAVKNGCDLNCGCAYTALLAAVRAGLVTEDEIDRCVTRLFATRIKLGEFDEQVPWTQIPESAVHCEKHQQLALRMARESMVLLKNDHQTLPLSKALRGIAVVGPNARNTTALQANYNGYAPGMVTLFDAILDKLSAGTQVNFHAGCSLAGDEPIDPKLHRQLGLMSTRRIGDSAETAVAEVDAVIAVLGLTAELEGEEGFTAIGGGDRDTLSLPGRQLELLKRLKEFGRPTVAVIMAGSPVDVAAVAEFADAVLYAWYPGEQGGNAIADVLFGETNPAGRLPVTFVKSLDDLPDFTDYNMAGRTYRFADTEPAYPFGFGLSYTSFEYSGFQCLEPTAPGRGASRPAAAGRSATVPALQTVSVVVTNTGDRDGDEVVQLYVRDVEASVLVPKLQLRRFRRIHLAAGESQTVSFELTGEDFQCFDDDGVAFVEPGEFEISIGGGQPCDPHSGAVSKMISIAGVPS